MLPDPTTKAMRRRAARLEAADASTWKCETCETIIESGKHCRPCGSYWEDVRNGLWDREEDWEPVRRDFETWAIRSAEGHE